MLTCAWAKLQSRTCTHSAFSMPGSLLGCNIVIANDPVGTDEKNLHARTSSLVEAPTILRAGTNGLYYAQSNRSNVCPNPTRRTAWIPVTAKALNRGAECRQIAPRTLSRVFQRRRDTTVQGCCAPEWWEECKRTPSILRVYPFSVEEKKNSFFSVKGF